MADIANSLERRLRRESGAAALSRTLLRAALILPLASAALAASAAVVLGFLGPLNADLDAFATLRLHAVVIAAASGLLLLALGARPLAALSLGCALVGGWGLSPVFAAPPSLPPACSSEPLRVAFANIEADPRNRGAWPAKADALVALDADVLMLVEANVDVLDGSSALLRAFPHRAQSLIYHDRQSGAFILSRRPLRAVGPQGREWGLPPNALAVMEVAGREIGLYALHLARPIIGPQARQAAWAAAQAGALPPVRIVAGDFNAAPWSAATRMIAEATETRVLPGIRRTWRGVYPVSVFGWTPPTIYGAQIDHILVSDGVALERIALFDMPSSVHWGVIADLRIARADDPGCVA